MPRPSPARRLLAVTAALALAVATAAASPSAGEAAARAAHAADTATREQTADQQVLHALHRLGFGPRPADVERVRAMGVDRWIALQLDPARIPDPAGDAVVARLPSLALDLPALLEQAPPPQLLRAGLRRDGMTAGDSARIGAELRRARVASTRLLADLQTARVARAVASERQLQEVMVDFWANHFNVFAAKGPYARHYLVGFERDAIRPHALGRFRDLLGAVAHSPAMLFYLDNAQSRANADAPTLGRRPRVLGRGPGDAAPRGLNENYARELLELHTLGVDGGYTQQDVIEVARALTGWTVVPPALGGGFAFRPALHDAGAKTVLGVRLPAGRGIEDGEQVLDILARHPATARHVATKLARRLVSDTPPAALVERATRAYLRTDGDVRAVVRTIVTSPEFFSDAAYRAKVKSPFELVVSAARALGAEPDASPRTAQAIARLGQPLYGHQAPNGWPETGDAWINTGAILGRINFGLAVARGTLPGAAIDRWPPARDLARAPRAEQVDGVARHLLGGAVSVDTRRVLASGENPLLRADTTTADGAMRGREPTGLAQIVGLALGSPEFQRR